MKKCFSLICTLLLVSSTNLLAQGRTLKQVMELQMPKTVADDYCGTRGASVCWNPDTKKYYASFAGNSKYPMGVFNSDGKRISDDELTCMADLRGLWYDPAAKKIMANGYNDNGWMYYTLNSIGIPETITTKYENMNQPGPQSVGAYDNKLRYIFFLVESRVVFYENYKNESVRIDDSVQIHWGRKKSQGAGSSENLYSENEDYNSTSVIATGIKESEIGLLNIASKQIELYNYRDGFLQQTFKLPESATTEAVFNFAFANGIYWLFDINNRKWIGYK